MGFKAVRFPADRVWQEKMEDNPVPQQSSTERSGRQEKEHRRGGWQEESGQEAGPWRSRSGRVSSDLRGGSQEPSQKRLGTHWALRKSPGSLTRVLSGQRGGKSLRAQGCRDSGGQRSAERPDIILLGSSDRGLGFPAVSVSGALHTQRN